MPRPRTYLTADGEVIGPKRRITVDNPAFFEKHFKGKSKKIFGLKTYSHNCWDTLWRKSTHAPHTFLLVWSYGSESKGGITDISLLDATPDYTLYVKNRLSNKLILQGFRTYDDMHYARQEINLEHSLIAYTIDLYEQPELIKTVGSLDRQKNKYKKKEHQEEVKTDTYWHRD
jgi:hypothetical protein